MLLKVIEFFDEANRTLVQRIPPHGSGEIPLGSQLIVQQNQEAVFFRDGKAMDVFGPGRHTLTTETLPIITRLLTIPWERSPFRAQVYFVGRQLFLDQKWGTRQPITVADRDFGMVRLRGFGKYAFRVVDAPLVINSLVGSQGKFTTEEITSYLRDLIVSRLSDLLGTLKVSLLELPGKLDELSAAARAKIGSDFARFGLELSDFFINAITPPPEVQSAIDARAGMAAVGDLRAYTLYQAGKSLQSLAENPGGAAGGMGVGVGMFMPSFLQQAMQAPPTSGSPAMAPAAGGRPAGLNLEQLQAPDPRQLVRQVAQSAGWQLDESTDPQWSLTIPLGALRKQVVTADFSRKDEKGYSVIRFATICGPATEQNAMQFLRFNSQLLHGAFAVEDGSSGPVIVLQANQLADTADALEVMRAVAAVAWQADQVEQRLLTTDQF